MKHKIHYKKQGDKPRAHISVCALKAQFDISFDLFAKEELTKLLTEEYIIKLLVRIFKTKNLDKNQLMGLFTSEELIDILYKLTDKEDPVRESLGNQKGLKRSQIAAALAEVFSREDLDEGTITMALFGLFEKKRQEELLAKLLAKKDLVAIVLNNLNDAASRKRDALVDIFEEKFLDRLFSGHHPRKISFGEGKSGTRFVSYYINGLPVFGRTTAVIRTIPDEPRTLIIAFMSDMYLESPYACLSSLMDDLIKEVNLKVLIIKHAPRGKKRAARDDPHLGIKEMGRDGLDAIRKEVTAALSKKHVTVVKSKRDEVLHLVFEPQVMRNISPHKAQPPTRRQWSGLHFGD